MISFIESRRTYGGEYVNGTCLSTDEKPIVGIANGSRLKEVNPQTGAVKRFQFDAESASWIEITREPGSGDEDVQRFGFTVGDNDTITPAFTVADLAAAVEDGATMIVSIGGVTFLANQVTANASAGTATLRGVADVGSSGAQEIQVSLANGAWEMTQTSIGGSGGGSVAVWEVSFRGRQTQWGVTTYNNPVIASEQKTRAELVNLLDDYDVVIAKVTLPDQYEVISIILSRNGNGVIGQFAGTYMYNNIYALVSYSLTYQESQYGEALDLVRVDYQLGSSPVNP